MAYRLRYTFNVDWVGEGEGPMASIPGATLGAGGGAQSKGFINTPGGQTLKGSGTGGIIQAADITTLTTNAASDMSTQINAAISQLQGFASGGG
jgi:hypothetical protein